MKPGKTSHAENVLKVTFRLTLDQAIAKHANRVDFQISKVLAKHAKYAMPVPSVTVPTPLNVPSVPLAKTW